MRPALFSAAAILGLAACATTSEVTIASQLEDFGLSDRNADCVADHMSERLSSTQLSRFASFLTTVDSPERPSDLVRAAERVSDPQIGRAFAGGITTCALGFGR